MVVCAIPSALFFMFLPESPKFLINSKTEKEPINVFHTMYQWNMGKCTDSLDIPTAH